MRKCKAGKALVVLSFLVILCSASSVLATVPDWMIRPGTIRHALSLEDGSYVYLDAVIVDKIKAKQDNPYFTIHECFNSSDRIIVLTLPSPELRLIQLVDVEGTITTLDNGCRAIINPNVYGYTDEDGNLLRHGPLVKGIFHPTPWEWKIDLTVSSTDANKSSSVSASTGVSSEEPNDSPAEPPSYYPTISDILEGDTSAAENSGTATCEMHIESFYDGIPEVSGLPDGSFVTLQAKDIGNAGTEEIDSITYNYFDMIEDPPASGTIRCYYSQPVSSDSRVNRISGQIRHLDENTPIIDIDTGPAGYDRQDPGEGQLQTADEGTIAWAKTFADGASVILTGKVVTTNQTDFPGAIYVQEPNSSGYSGGIRVCYSTTTYNRGDILDIEGTVATADDGEREINATDVTFVEQNTLPGPFGMPNRVLGGCDFNVYTPGISNPSGSGKGLYNKELLVKIWGKVTAIDATNKFFYIDDGTGFQDGSGNTGVKVSWDWPTAGKPSITPPAVDWYASVTGISSSDTADSGTTYYRVLRPRDQHDILVFSPDDSAPPTVTITCPPDGQINKAPGQSTVQLAGIATDSETGIALVEVKIDSGQWQPATYNSTNHTWSYNWQNPQSGKIWARATDFAGHTTTIDKDVIVNTITKVVYVKPDGTGDGSSWSNAEDKVADALVVTGVTEVWVAVGTYEEQITLINGVSLFGGFIGTETYREQRNWNTNTTILDGTKSGNVIVAPAGVTTITIVDGFTIQNGRASLSGGGILCNSGSPTITRNTITGNTAAYGSGAGIYCYNSSAVIADNNITGNTSSSTVYGTGGGIGCSSSSPQISGNSITNNTSVLNGGGIWCSNNSAPTISNNTINNNKAAGYVDVYGTYHPSYGGGIFSSGSSPTVVNNDISSNMSHRGGGIYCENASTPIISGNNITLNTLYPIGPANYGGAIYVSSCTPTISNNVIRANTADNAAGIYSTGSTSTIINNVIIGNVSTLSGNYAGGIFYYGNSSVHGTIINNTIVGNSASQGGGIYFSASITVANNIVAFNTSGIYNYGQPSLSNNCVYGNTSYDYSGFTNPADPTGINGNIKVDPLFASKNYGNMHIQPGSPCNNAGNNSVVQSNWLDIDGQSRTLNGTVDIGADESDGTTWQVTPQIIRVSVSGNDSNDGSSWTCPKRTVQAAVNTAAAVGGEVWVKAGTYFEAINLMPFSYMFGGFTGNETDKDQRNWRTNFSILDAAHKRSVVTSYSPCMLSAIDGFHITNGKNNYGAGINCQNCASLTISHNTIENNVGITLGYDSNMKGAGIYTANGCPIISNNVIKGNTLSNPSFVAEGGGICCSGGSPIITNNTITGNSATGDATRSGGGGISCGYICTAQVSNNIVAFNSSGILSGVNATLQKNCVYGNTSYQYYGSVAHPTDISSDPLFLDYQNGDLHILWTSPCRDAGLNSVVIPYDLDMDVQARRNGTVDIGADETYECWHYRLSLTPATNPNPMGSSVLVTAYVEDTTTGQPAVGLRVDFSVDAGEILSVTYAGEPINLPSGTQIAYGFTGSDGKIELYVTRPDQGSINVTSTIEECGLQVGKTAKIAFYDASNTNPVYLVFLIDVTASTFSGQEMMNGVNDTVDYLYSQLQAQGRQFNVAGIKFSEKYPPNSNVGGNQAELYDFTTDPAVFKTWVSAGGLGGSIEMQFNILDFAKGMKPEAIPGLYIALATDEDSDSSLDKAQLAVNLTNSGSIVFIDPTKEKADDWVTLLTDYYRPLAVNGGAIEETNLGSFRFELMRQAILGY